MAFGVPTVHPVPLYHGTAQTCIGRPELFHIIDDGGLSPNCPSRTIVPWDGMDVLRRTQAVLHYGHGMLSPNCPPHTIVPWDGMDMLRRTQAVPHYDGGLSPNCPSCSIVPWDGMDIYRTT